MGTILDLDELAAASLANDDYLLIRDTSDVTNKDKKLQAGVFARKDGTPTAARVARWKDANSLEDGGFAVSDIARLSTAQSFAALNTFSAGVSFGETTLANYKELTWTPGLRFGGASVGMTYTTQVGTYTRIGNRMLIHCEIILSAKGSSTGIANIVGLPFTVNKTAIAMCYWSGFAASYTCILALVIAGGTLVGLRGNTAAAANVDVDLTHAAFNNTSVLFFDAMYQI